MLKELSAFKQKSYREKWDRTGRLEGICLGLSSFWSEAVLRSPKDRWGVPKNDTESRLQAMEVQTNAKKILTEQLIHDLRKARIKEGHVNLGTAYDALKLVKQNTGRDLPNEALIAMEQSHNELVRRKGRITRETIEKFGLTASLIRMDAAWKSIPDVLEKCKCYIMIFCAGRSNHAVTAYRTGGVLSTHYYVFEPNFGEYLCENTDDLRELLESIKNAKAYERPQTMDIWQVTI